MSFLIGCSTPPPPPKIVPLEISPPAPEIPEQPKQVEPELTPEQLKKEIAAYQKLLDKLEEIEKEVTSKMALGRAASFFLSEDDEAAMRSGEIFLSYLTVVKKDIRDRLKTLRAN